MPESPSAAAVFDTEHAYIPLRSGKLTAIALEDRRSLWTVEAPTMLAPATGEALVFVAGKQDIRALDRTTGRQVWRTMLDDSAIIAPVFDTGWMFVGTESGLVTALRAADGEVLWELKAGKPLGALPAPSGTSIYLPLSDGRIVAADLHTGKVLWTRTLGGPPSDILALDDRLFVGSRDNSFYCLALTNGSNRWTWPTGGDIVGAPIVDEARVYFMSLDNVLRALDRRSGSQRWYRPLSSRTIGGPVRSGSLIVMANLAPQLHAYHSADGRPAGSSPPPERDARASTLAAPPYMISREGRDAFVLLTREGVIELLTYAGADSKSK